jgi:hypothetical protein
MPVLNYSECIDQYLSDVDPVDFDWLSSGNNGNSFYIDRLIGGSTALINDYINSGSFCRKL